MKRKSIIFLSITGLFILLTCGAAGFVIFGPNTLNRTAVSVTVPRDADYEQLLDTLESHGILRSETTFYLVSKAMKFKTVRIGHYTITPKMSNYKLVRLLRTGQHYPVRFSFNNVRTLDQFAEKASNTFFFSKDELLALLYDPAFLKKYNMDIFTCPAMFIPDSYEFYYDVTPEDFVNRMFRYYQLFWDKNRLERAEAIGLSPIEVVTLASIVEEENSRPSEKAVIAGLYINRLKKNMLLQSDPTVKFALRDFTRQRILNADLQTDSPYNTYKFKGLPPGPIRFPEASTVDSVLHYAHHNYLYMCAKEDFSGFHNFTPSASQHARNAMRYRAALNRRNIKR